jgi:hypothetical protein
MFHNLRNWDLHTGQARRGRFEHVATLSSQRTDPDQHKKNPRAAQSRISALTENGWAGGRLDLRRRAHRAPLLRLRGVGSARPRPSVGRRRGPGMAHSLISACLACPGPALVPRARAPGLPWWCIAGGGGGSLRGGPPMVAARRLLTRPPAPLLQIAAPLRPPKRGRRCEIAASRSWTFHPSKPRRESHAYPRRACSPADTHAPSCTNGSSFFTRSSMAAINLPTVPSCPLGRSPTLNFSAKVIELMELRRGRGFIMSRLFHPHADIDLQ